MVNWLKRGILFSLIFVIFTIPVAFGALSQIDTNSIRLLQSSLPKFLDTPLSIFSLLGSFEVTTLLLFVIACKKFGLKKAILILAIFSFGIVLELIGKSFITHPSPESVYFRYNLSLYLPSGSVQTGHSYPSGHSYRAAFLTIFFVHLIASSKKRVLLYLAFAIMLISRVSLGEHWASDVIGGALLGVSFAYFSSASLSVGFLKPNQVK